MSFKEIIWFIPFTSFLAGYFSLSLIYRPKTCKTPSLIGKQLNEAVVLASTHNLNLLLLEQQDDNDLPEGTVIVQNPQPNTSIKPNQTIFCVAAKHPVSLAPNLILKKYEISLATLNEQGIHAQYHFLDSSYPKETCFAQSPNPQTRLSSKSMLLYISAAHSQPVLFPNMKGKAICDIIEFLKPYSITPTIIHYPPLEPHDCMNGCIVIDQRPLAGSLVSLDSEKPLHVQLQAAPA